MSGTKRFGITRRQALAGSLAAPLILPAGIRTGHAQSINRERVILGMTQEPVQFNPLLWVNAGTENVPETCMFDALWDVNEKGEFIANLATKIPSKENGGISADGLVWKIELRPDVKWTDGQPFTAKDVEFTYQTIINPAVAIRSRSGFDLIKNFKVVDSTHIEIELSRSYVPFAWAWQNMHIVPQHLLSKESNINTSGFNSQPVGTGPFLLKSRTAGSHMIYERNPNYHRGAAKFRQFIHKFVPDQLVLYGQAKTGEVDYMGLSGVPGDRWREAAAIPDRDLLTTPQPWVQFVYFNCGKPQFKDPKVRKALYMALEMQKSIDDVYFGTYKRTLSYLHTSHWAYNSSLKDPTPNPEAATKLLDEAGWKVGADGVREKDGVKLKFTMSTTAGVPARQNAQALFQQNWKRIGVEMEIRNFPASVVWGEYTTKSQFDTLLVSWEPTVGMDPDYTARAHSKQIPAKTGVGSNYVQYENAEVDRLLELGVTQANIEDRKATYARIQEILAEEVPFAPHGGTYQGNLKKKQLTGIKPNGYTVNAAWNLYEWAWA
ncbi:peptide ABC transporter substrate-binding protein [Limobrevibacterium gyesilva]|uniref:Peptide ABC transporter substrate-binding protein n=1 Tax=Limobrevibacterium gyesilva TaxID=2991712 RepID=A0AA41YS54_9PROT|nr:peptide ABC transporter substrate-binding protein [Limobrevibacterium gyesilva]MCW3475525.1 peptide ABC transporter substrate-binding protein [Limobrevibacterium gyesilva]